MKMEDCDFLFVGFSVSEQREGYFPELVKLTAESGPRCSLQSIGGLTFRDLAHLIDFLRFDSSKYVVFEIATCRRFRATLEYERYFSYLAHAVCKAGAIPCFFNLPREGFTSGDDDLDRRLIAFASENGFPYYSLYREMAQLHSQGRIAEYLRDGTHTTKLGSEFYARHALEFINAVRSSPKPPTFHYAPEDRLWPTWIPPIALSPDAEAVMFTRRGLELPCVRINENETVQFRLPEDISIESIVTILGPLTGVIRIDGGEREVTLTAYDRDCHYRRIALLNYASSAGTLSVTQLPGRPPIPLSKGIPNDGPRIGEIGGFLALQRL